jgi:hypothetical protein
MHNFNYFCEINFLHSLAAKLHWIIQTLESTVQTSLQLNQSL